MADAPTKFYLQWNVINWITVVTMVFVAMMIFGAIASSARQWSKKMDAAANDA